MTNNSIFVLYTPSKPTSHISYKYISKYNHAFLSWIVCMLSKPYHYSSLLLTGFPDHSTASCTHNTEASWTLWKFCLSPTLLLLWLWTSHTNCTDAQPHQAHYVGSWSDNVAYAGAVSYTFTHLGVCWHTSWQIGSCWHLYKPIYTQGAILLIVCLLYATVHAITWYILWTKSAELTHKLPHIMTNLAHRHIITQYTSAWPQQLPTYAYSICSVRWTHHFTL